MFLTMCVSWFHPVLAQTSFLAQATSRMFDQMGLGAAILLTVVGTILHWRLPELRMSAEESVKDSKMTEEQARRQIRFYTRCATVATFVGVAVLLVVMFDLSRGG